MYIAFKKNNGQANYFLRESCIIDEQLTFRDLLDLGTDPSSFIKYIGTNAFYFDEIIEEKISESGAVHDMDEIEELFWPWIRPDVKRAIDTFRNRSFKDGTKKLSKEEKNKIAESVNDFDKRRIHYLKFANMDQGPVENMPSVLFKNLIHQSRDEIEQNFLRQEFTLKPHELKSYVYTVFNLQSFFSSFMAKEMPHALNQEKVDNYFLEEVCKLNEKLFLKTDELDDYMFRYIIMFFDYAYANTRLLDDFTNAFMNRHRHFKPRKEKSISTSNACKIFDITAQKLRTMTKKELTKLYRKLARDHHPDIGGSHDKFVQLGSAYKSLLEKIK